METDRMKPQRIASLLAASTEMLYGLGLGEKVVAVSHECDFPPDVMGKPRATTTHIIVDAASGEIDRQVRQRTGAGEPIYHVDADLLASLRCDLIVTQAHCDVCAVSLGDVERAVRENDSLREAVVLALNPTTLDELLGDILRLGDATGCPDTAREYVAKLRGRLDAVRTKTATVERRPRVVCIEWLDPVMVAANWMPDIVEMAGGECGLAEAGERSRYTDWDELLAFDPEVIVLMPCGFDLPRTLEEAKVLRQRPNWQTIAAVRDGRVYAVDGNAYFNRSGPRIVDSVEILAGLLHPAVLDGEYLVPENVAARFVGE